MKRIWNRDSLKKHYIRIEQEAKARGFRDDELEHPYLDKLSHQTKSHRILRMVELAYYLGKLKGISEADEGFTPISIDPLEHINKL